MKILYSVCLIMAICCSCDTKEVKRFDDRDMFTTTIRNTSNDVLDISDYVDSLRQITLHMPKDILVGNIMQIIIHDDWIGMLDTQTKSIHIVGFDGQLIKNIRRYGRGPGEYLSIAKILYDEQNDQLLVYDDQQRSMLFYDLEGNHVKTIKDFGDRAPLRDIINLPSGRFLCSRFDNTPGTSKDDLVGVWETDSEGKFVRYLFHDDKIYPSLFVQYAYYLYNSPEAEAGYFDHNTYDVFSYKRDSLFRRIEFDFPGERVLKDFEGEGSTDEKYVIPFIAHHKGGYVFSMWTDSHDKPFVSLISTASKELRTGATFSNFIGDQLACSGIFIPNNSTNILTSILPTELLLSITTNKQWPQEYKIAAKQIVGNRTEKEIADMDPVITLLTVKN